MKGIALAVGLSVGLMAQPAKAENWVLVGQDGQGSLEIETEEIKYRGSQALYMVRVTDAQPDSLGGQVGILIQEMQCNKSAWRAIQLVRYTMSGVMVSRESRVGRWTPVYLNSVGNAVYRIVCQ